MVEYGIRQAMQDRVTIVTSTKEEADTKKEEEPPVIIKSKQCKQPKTLPTVHDIGVIIGAAAFSFLLIWIPSTYTTGMRNGVWEIGTASFACLTASVSTCAFACFMRPDVLGRPSTCAAMYLSAQSIASSWHVLSVCPGKLSKPEENQRKTF